MLYPLFTNLLQLAFRLLRRLFDDLRQLAVYDVSSVGRELLDNELSLGLLLERLLDELRKIGLGLRLSFRRGFRFLVDPPLIDGSELSFRFFLNRLLNDLH